MNSPKHSTDLSNRRRRLGASRETMAAGLGLPVDTVKAIEAQGKLTDELAAAIRSADNPKRLEDLYLPFKPKKKTKASEARDKGFEPLALRIWSRDESLTDLNAAATEFLNPEKEVDTIEKVLEGVGHILAEAISAFSRDNVQLSLSSKILALAGSLSCFPLFSC